MAVDTVLFDLDDTLIDWWGSMQRCLRELADDEVVEALLAHCRAACWEVRPGTDHVWHRNSWALHTRRHQHWPVALPHLDAEEVALLMKRFDDELWVGFFPDAVPALDELVDTHRLAVLSNNHLLPDEVVRLRLHDWFEACVAAPPDARKPDPAAFSFALGELGGVEPARCAYVGDSIKADALGALDAGLVPVWVDRWDDPWPDRPAGVQRIGSLAELSPLLATF